MNVFIIPAHFRYTESCMGMNKSGRRPLNFGLRFKLTAIILKISATCLSYVSTNRAVHAVQSTCGSTTPRGLCPPCILMASVQIMTGWLQYLPIPPKSLITRLATHSTLMNRGNRMKRMQSWGKGHQGHCLGSPQAGHLDSIGYFTFASADRLVKGCGVGEK